MKRLLPAPILSVSLFVLWILLMQTVDPGTLLIGGILAVFWPAFFARLRPATVRIRRPLLCLRLFGRVVADMVASNVRVAWAILTRRTARLRSGFVYVPLQLRDPNGLAALAAIVTFTPGTAWAQLSADHRILLLHVFDFASEAEVIAEIQQRYETPLREIFE